MNFWWWEGQNLTHKKRVPWTHMLSVSHVKCHLRFPKLASCFVSWLKTILCSEFIWKNLIRPDKPGDLSLLLRQQSAARDLLRQLPEVFGGASNLLLWTHLWQLWRRYESHSAFRRIPKKDISWLKTPGKCSHLGGEEPSSFGSAKYLWQTMGCERIWGKPDVTGVQEEVFS